MEVAQGALVAEPLAGGTAAKAGILAGDVITGLNGQPIKDARDLARKIASMGPQSSAKLVVRRKGKEKAVEVTLGRLPQERQARAGFEEQDGMAANAPQLGLMLAPAGWWQGPAPRVWSSSTSARTGRRSNSASNPGTSFSTLAARPSRRLPMSVRRWRRLAGHKSAPS